MKKIFPAALILILAIAIPSMCPAQGPEAEAENLYRQFRDLYRKEHGTKADILKAIDYAKSAYDLMPEIYKYSFSLGAAHHAIKKYDEALDWLSKSSPLASNDAEKQSIRCIQADCRMQIAKAEYAYRSTRVGPGMDIELRLKEGRNELEDEIIERLPPVLSSVSADGSPRTIIDILRGKFEHMDAFYADPFDVVSLDSDRDAQTHYEKGIKDFYRVFINLYFKTKPERIITVVISSSPYDLLEATKSLYPEIDYALNSPFLGYFNPSDNLIMANGGRSGYGTLLHEMIHALVESDFPDAPQWLNEGLASLYERTEWKESGLKPLPNWRFDYIKEKDIGSLDTIAADIGNRRFKYSDIRMLLLYIESTGRIGEFYEYVKSNKDEFSMRDCLAHFEIDEDGWRTFADRVLYEYRAEILSQKGTFHNPDEVRYLQHALNTVLGAELNVDGIWGDSSSRKLREFQEKFGLEPDGVLGPKTKAELKKQFVLATAE